VQRDPWNMLLSNITSIDTVSNTLIVCILHEDSLEIILDRFDQVLDKCNIKIFDESAEKIDTLLKKMQCRYF
jgi:hypothetical protein